MKEADERLESMVQALTEMIEVNHNLYVANYQLHRANQVLIRQLDESLKFIANLIAKKLPTRFIDIDDIEDKK